MKKLVLVVAMAMVSVSFGAGRAAAQGPQGAGAGSASSSSSSGSTHSLNPIKWVKKDPKSASDTLDAKDEQDKKLTANCRLKESCQQTRTPRALAKTSRHLMSALRPCTPAKTWDSISVA